MGIRLKQALAQGRVVRVFGMGQLCHPKIVEMIGHMGAWDAIWLDQEHVGLTVPQLEEATRAGRAANIETFVRLAATDYATTMRPLEAGANGIMAAMLRSAAEAANVVRWAKFHPQGERGINGTGADGRFGTMAAKDYFAKANAETFVAIQIEHKDAVAEVEKIAAIPGIDILFVGPYDLSQTLGIPAEVDKPPMWDALRRVAAAAKQNGIHWAILPPNADYARRCVELGCRMLSIGLDVWSVSRGLKTFETEYGEFFSK